VTVEADILGASAFASVSEAGAYRPTNGRTEISEGQSRQRRSDRPYHEEIRSSV